MTTTVAIIGAGPIGLELAVALKRAGVEYVQFDAGQIGQTISWLFPPQTRFFSSAERIAIAGVPLQTVDQLKPTREEYLAYLRAIVQMFDLKVRTYEPIIDIQRDGDGFFLTTRQGWTTNTCLAQKLVLATGGTARVRMLGVPGEDLPFVSHFLADPHTYFKKRVCIIGGKNSAVEAALRLYNLGAEVTISYRRGEFDPKSIKYWLLPEINGLVKAGRIRAYFNTAVARIEPDKVVLQPNDAGGEISVATDFVLAMTGYYADMTLCKMAGIELVGECEKPVYNQRTMESSVPGIYLAGTVVGGTQEKYQVFIENGHVHVDRIVAALTGQSPPAESAGFDRPES